MEPEDQANWLFLEQSEEFRGYWEVVSLYPEYFFDFEPLIGAYRLVSPTTIAEFLDLANEKGYEVAFVEDPTHILNAYEYLNEPPNVSLHSNLETSQQGFFPWQVTGYNKLIRDETLSAGYVVWLTGGGKAFFIASAIKYHQEQGHPFDLALVIVKSHNKIDMQRKLRGLGDIDSVLVDGDLTVKRIRNGEPTMVPGPRMKAYEEVERKLAAGEQVVMVVNYEKLRDDTSYFQTLVRKRNLLLFWDEMPAKLSNRETKLYRAVKKVLYASFYSRPRPKWMRHWCLTATPIENGPDGVYSCVNLMSPGLLGTVSDFYAQYVGSFNPLSRKPDSWKNLDRLEAKLAFMVHRVDKSDPQVAAMFPDVLPIDTPIDWNPKHRAIYDKLTGKAHDLVDQLEDANILSMIQIMQMVCDAPSMVVKSAQNRQAFYETMGGLTKGPTGSDIALILLDQLGSMSFTDAGHTKLETWREIICEKHPGEKVVTHSTWSAYIFPVWEHWLQKWGVSYVIYHGTDKQKQTALDAFRNDPDIQVFLSGDAGADSIDIAEAPVGVNYNWPWKWVTVKQREGRRDRVTSTFDTIYTYTLTMPDSVDVRKKAICEKKFEYHAAVFDGKAMDESFSASLTREDLLHILFGGDYETR
jgi:hypothetical protein